MNNKSSITFLIIAIIIIAALVLFTRRSEAPTMDILPETEETSEQVTEEETMSEESNQTPQEETKTTTTASGLQITILKEGTGEAAAAGDTVYVNYTGKLQNGTVFDSNVLAEFGHVTPFAFTLGQNMVIRGWEEGVLGMKEGEKRLLVIPAELGYGGAAIGSIPPFSTLTFEVEVLQIAHN